MNINICHLYPDVLNLYGDRGNIICLKKRLEWRGIEATVTEIPIGKCDSLSDYDIFFIGGGQDFEQKVLLGDLAGSKGELIKQAVEDDKTFLCVCGGYQIMGKYYETYDGQRCDFLGAIDFYTVGTKKRMIGNYTYKCSDASGGSIVHGFENHSGHTFLGNGVEPLGTVTEGYGNNGKDGTEGCRYKNVFCTYSHGPVLPRNPELCDFILDTAIARKARSSAQ